MPQISALYISLNSYILIIGINSKVQGQYLEFKPLQDRKKFTFLHWTMN